MVRVMVGCTRSIRQYAGLFIILKNKILYMKHEIYENFLIMYFPLLLNMDFCVMIT